MSKGVGGLPKGWRREIKVRQNGKSAGKEDMYLYTPENIKIRSNVQLKAYLKKTKSKFSVDDFSLSLSKKINPQAKVKRSKPSNSSVQKKTAKQPLKSQRKDLSPKYKMSVKKLTKQKKAPVKSASKVAVKSDAKQKATAKAVKPKVPGKSIVKSTSKPKSKVSNKKDVKPAAKKIMKTDEESHVDVESLEEPKSSIKKDIKKPDVESKKASGKIVSENKITESPEKIVLQVYPTAKVAKKFPSQTARKCIVSRTPRKAPGDEIESMPATPSSSNSSTRVAIIKASPEAAGKSSDNPDTNDDDAKSLRIRQRVMEKPSESPRVSPNNDQPASAPKKTATNDDGSTNISQSSTGLLSALKKVFSRK